MKFSQKGPSENLGCDTLKTTTTRDIRARCQKASFAWSIGAREARRSGASSRMKPHQLTVRVSRNSAHISLVRCTREIGIRAALGAQRREFSRWF